MTIAIGLIARHARLLRRQIVLAADSQLTYPTGPKILDSQKINCVRFANAAILVAQSGFAAISKHFVELMTEKARSISIENKNTVSALAEETMREIRKPIFQTVRELNVPPENIGTYIQLNHHCEMLLASFFDGEPILSTIGILDCTPRPAENKNFAAIGIGSELATYLLNEYGMADPDFLFSENIAISVVQKVTDNVRDCGGPIQSGIVFPSMEDKRRTSAALILEPDLIQSVANELRRAERASLKQKREQMLTVIQNTWGGELGETVAAKLRADQRGE